MIANIHASCIRLGEAGKAFGVSRAGILLLGKSGTGKSDLVLRFLSQGGILVADDRVELFLKRNLLFGRPSASGAGLLEVRGVGIITLPHQSEVRINLVVDLNASPERLPSHAQFLPPRKLGLAADRRPPLIRANAYEASAPAKIAAAAAAYSRRLFRDSVPPR